ncbi:MAG: anhydro-N-acetylmuramic acid kinase [Rubrivivax sp.]
MYIGLMSGTSLDGVDGALVRFDSLGNDSAPQLAVLAHAHQPFDAALRESLLSLNGRGDDELHRAAMAANAVADAYSQVVESLIAQAGVGRQQIRALGAHGQTVRHQPLATVGGAYTIQLINGALLAERCGIDVVCDFRSRDIAAGGQGAPLAPAFHARHFAAPGRHVAVLNLGGIGNLSLLPASGLGPVRGFDCGPANALLDAWCAQHRGSAFDDDGAWAATGTVDAPLLALLLADSFFALAPPKSTGRELFNIGWLQDALQRVGGCVSVVDVQATLVELTATAAAQALLEYGPQSSELLVCGGGAFNGFLMRRLQAHLKTVSVHSTAVRGVPPDQVEALAFASLARDFVERRPGNLPDVTGARGARLLGAMYPA